MHRRKWVVLLALLFSPAVFIASLYLLAATFRMSHGTPTPSWVLEYLWSQGVEGDEELFGLVGLILWTVSWSYFLAALLTYRKLTARTMFPLVFIGVSFAVPYCAALEHLWRPHWALGNCIAAAVCVVIYGLVWFAYAKMLSPRKST